MKTNWKTKLKTVLEKYEFSELSTNSQLRITAKTGSSGVFTAFRSGQLVGNRQNNESLTSDEKFWIEERIAIKHFDGLIPLPEAIEQANAEFQSIRGSPVISAEERCWNYPCRTLLHGASVCPKCEQEQGKVSF